MVFLNLFEVKLRNTKSFYVLLISFFMLTLTKWSNTEWEVTPILYSEFSNIEFMLLNSGWKSDFVIYVIRIELNEVEINHEKVLIEKVRHFDPEKCS